MAEYSYKAASLDGKTVRGRQTANNPRQLKEQLSRQELYLLECRERKKAAGKRLRANRLSDFCRELSSMLGTGVTLVRAMQVIKNRDLSPAVKNAFFELDRQIKRGAALSDAMEQQGGAFPELLISMVKSGEANGHLDKALARMAEHYEAEQRTNREIKGALFYPALLSEALAAVEGFDGKLSETVTVGEETGRVDELLTSVAESFDHESSVAIKKPVQLIEPVMILIMALVIVAVMLSVMLPIYQMYGNIEQMNF